MDIALDDLHVTDNEAAGRYELRIGDEVAFLRYRRPDSATIALVHTEVPEALEGQGIAGKLAKHALDDAREHHLDVIPTCPYVAGYIERHPEYQDLVVPASRR